MVSARLPDPGPIRVLVCGPAAELARDPAFRLVRADSPEDVRRCLDETAFDCAVLGLEQAGGADGLRALARAAPSTALVVIASEPDEVRAAVRAGAHRCLPAGEVSGPLLRIAVTEAIERRAAGRGPALAGAVTVRRLAGTVEPRGHIERMSAYCALLAGPAGVDPELMRVASRLHDIGKVVVPDAILGKPGPLTPAERREIERHAELGCRLLAGSEVEFLDLASTIAHTHHERYDGAGYPRRLAGVDIPLSGRIAALADAFDALSTDRVYRRALPFDDVVATVRGERGRQFDPALVDALLGALPQVREIMERYPDEPGEGPERRTELLTLQQAAATLGVSQSRLRRWSDEGRIGAVRTAGGHRRFRLDAVRRLALEIGTGPAVRPLEPAPEPLPTLAARLSADGPELLRAAAAALYRTGHPGWFATPAAGPPAAEWVDELAAACAAGRYGRTRRATETLMRRAQLHGAGLLERHVFLERFSMACQRALTLSGAPREEQALARRLFGALGQALLSGLD
jgi:excisionase family DNA binding protein